MKGKYVTLIRIAEDTKEWQRWKRAESYTSFLADYLKKKAYMLHTLKWVKD